MMKRPEFLETKRTPRYSLRKLNVGVASVLLGVTIFGINFTDHSVKAATTETGPSISANSTRQNPAFVLTTQTNTQGETSGQTSTQGETSGQTNTQGETSASNNTTETQGSAGNERNAAGTVDQNNINTQLAKENQKLANDNNLTSSDNYSSNIYKGKDGKYYKIVTIYGNDYVYRAADIQANGTAFGQWATTAEDTKNNINISKEDLGNGQTRWTVTFFPNKGLQNVGSNLSGLTSAKFGIALTSDYQIVGNVDMDVISDPNQTFMSHTFEPGSSSATDWPVQNPPAKVKFSFNPNTDVDPNTGLINNSKTLPAYNNKYLQPSYYFTTATTTGAINLWQTYFFNHRNDVKYYNAYDGSPYLGYGHDFHFNNFEIKNRTGVDGAKFGDKIIYDKLGYRLNSKNGVANSNGVVNSDNFNQAMEFKSQGSTGNSQTQFSSYVISFTTQHTDSHEVELATGWKNQQFSGISANIYSYQNAGYYNMFSRLYGEQRALTPADAAEPYVPLNPKDIIPNWVPANEAMKNIHNEYLNNAQINVLRNKILNNITNPDAVNNIIKEGNSLNDAMKNLGNSIGQYDPHGSFADHKVDKTKASDRYQYADSGKKSAYDTATDAVSNIISVENGTVNKNKGIYADQATVEKLTNKENTAWTALDGVKPDADKITPKVPDKKVPVADTHKLTDTEKGEVKKNVEDANKGNFPDGTKVDVGDDGTATITYPDQTKSTDTIPGDKLVEGKDSGSTSGQTDADKITPKVPDKKVPVADTHKLTDTEKGEVKKNVEDANKGNFPDGTKVDVGDDGTATITYPDQTKSTDTIPGDKLVEGKDSGSTSGQTDADKITPKVPDKKVPVADTHKLTDTEKGEVKKNVEDANKGNFPDGTKVDVGDDGTATITYPDQTKSTDTIPGDKLVEGKDSGSTSGQTDADKITPKVPDKKVPVADTHKLTDTEKGEVKKNVEDANKGNFPDGTKVDVGDDGTATITYPDQTKSTDTIPGDKLVEGKDSGSTSGQTDADKITPKVPDKKVPVADTHKLTDTEKGEVKKNVEDANKGNFPDGTKVDVGDDGTATITYPDQTKSTDTIPGDKLVEGKDSGSTSGQTDADKITPKVPDKKVPVADTHKLTDTEKGEVKKNVEDANKGNFPDGTKVDVGDDGTATITYPDQTKSTDTIPGDKLVEGKDSGSTSGQTDADKITPKVPDKKVPVADTHKLTDTEKGEVKKNVEDANKGNFPDGTKVDVGDDGTATITYPDQTKSTDTIPGDKLVEGKDSGSTSGQTDADKITPKVPDKKVPVADTHKLTDTEKGEVKKNVEDANKGNFPDGTKVDVGDDGTATITYPDQTKSTDTIPGDKLVEGKDSGSTSGQTDADKITPKVPDKKVPVADTHKLTDTEKGEVKKNVEDANKGNFPDGTKVDVGDDGTATITYPDQTKSTDTIPGDKLVEGKDSGSTSGQTDADKITPKVPDKKVPVADTHKLTDTEKGEVKKNVEDANKGNFPDGTKVDVGDDGTATITYPDQTKSTDTIPGDKLVEGKDSGSTSGQTDADKITPKVPDKKVPVADTHKLTDTEKGEVKKNVEDANKGNFPDGTKVDVGDDGTATITYPDQTKSTDTIPGDKLVEGKDSGSTSGQTDADKITPKVPDKKVPVADTHKLTDTEKGEVKKNVEDANKGNFPDGTKVDVGDDGTATITYPDQTKSTDTIPGDKLVEGKDSGSTSGQTDADKITPKVPDKKVPVADTHKLTDTEKGEVKKNVEDANKGNFPDGTKVDVGDDGTATITYPDQTKSTDTIPGDKLVEGKDSGSTSGQTDADKITPKVPDKKVPVADTHKLTDTEKGEVKKNVEDANKGNFPDGTKVDVGDDGTATITYPDQTKSTDTIPGDKLVEGKDSGSTSGQTDADKITPKVPDKKVPVADTHKLTDTEKGEVKKNVEDANKGNFPDGTKVDVGDDGTATITYPDQTKSTDTIPGDKLVEGKDSGSTSGQTDADKITPKVPDKKVPVADTHKLTDTEKGEVKKNVEDANKGNFPDGTKVDVGDDGTATITYPDQTKSTDTIPGDKLVEGKDSGSTSGQTDADKITPKVPDKKVPVADTHKLTDTEKGEVKKNVEDANKGNFPDGTKVDVGDDGTATITYPDQTKSTDTIPGDKLVEGKDSGSTSGQTDADKITPKVPDKKVPVADTHKLTDTEKGEVKKNVEDANKGNFPDGTKVDVGDDGTATITYPDQTKSTDTIPGDKLVEGKDSGSTSGQTDADKITPKVPDKKVPVADTHKLTDTEKGEVKKNVEDANKGNFPDGTKVDVGDDGTATITYPDQTKSTDTIPGDKLVEGKDSGSTSGQTDADKITPKVPDKKVPVADTHKLTDTEKGEVKKNVEDANKGNFPDGTKVDVGDDGTATITYPDQTKSTDTIPGDKLVEGKDSGSTSGQTDADKITPKVPDKKVPVADTHKLTDTEKGEVKKNVEDANKGNFPDGTKVDVGDDGTATITYPDQTKSTDTIPGDKLVEGKDSGSTSGQTDADKITPKVPDKKVPVADTHKLTDTEKGEVKKNVEDANKGNFPDGTKVDVGDDGTATITYPDQTKSTDTIPGDKLVEGKDSGSTSGQTDADKITPKVPDKKVPVADTHKLTDTEKGEVKKNVEDANKGNFPDGTKVDVGDDGTATITYPDQTKSTDTIPGDKLVEGKDSGSTSGQTDADKITPKVPDKKVPVADTHKLTDTEKGEVKKNVEDANKGNFPDGTKVDVGDDGTATITYPDQTKSTDTIPGDQLVQGQKGDTTDAGKITPTVPGDKVTVKDPSHLTDDEKNQVKNNVDNANKDKFPAGTDVTVGDDGTTTVKYPDGSKDTIPGDQLVQGQKGDTTDAGKITPTVPGDKVTVKDPSHLTDDEKNQVKNNVDNANKDKFPAGTDVTVGDDGTTTVKYPDGSKDTIPGDQLVQGQKGDTTDAGKITPTVPGDKVTVKDPSHLTDDEKNQVKNNVDNANKDKFPAGTEVTVGDDGTTTVTYPDGSKDTIPGSDLVRQSTDADKTTPSVPETKVPVTNPSHLTDSEKDQVKTNVTNANKDTLPSGSQITVGDDGTATITYPDGSKDTIPGRDLIKGISGNKHDSNSSSGSNGTISNTDDETSGDTVNNAESMNGNTAKSGSKNNSLKTLPQTGTKDVTILEILGLFLSLFGLLGLKKKHHEE